MQVLVNSPCHPHRSNSHIKLTEAHIARSQLNSGLPLSHSFSRMSSNCSDEFFQATNHAEQTFRKMETYLQHKQLCDVLLIAGDHKIPAHRWVSTESSLLTFKCPTFTAKTDGSTGQKGTLLKMQCSTSPEINWNETEFTLVILRQNQTIRQLLKTKC